VTSKGRVNVTRRESAIRVDLTFECSPERSSERLKVADFCPTRSAELDPLPSPEPFEFQGRGSERNGHSVTPIEDKSSALAAPLRRKQPFANAEFSVHTWSLTTHVYGGDGCIRFAANASFFDSAASVPIASTSPSPRIQSI